MSVPIPPASASAAPMADRPDHEADKPLPDPCTVSTGGCDPLMDDCAEAMGGDDPATAYAAAMLWYQGYPDPPHPAV